MIVECPTDNEIDTVLLEHLANLSGIIDLVHHLEDSMRSGRIFLAKTRANSSSGAAISQISYNRAEMSVKGATAEVKFTDSSTATPKFHLIDSLGPLGSDDANTLPSDRSLDPINWFCGVLVPPALRHAQACFRRSTRLVVELATRRAALIDSTRRLTDLLKLRRHFDAELIPPAVSNIPSMTPT